MSPAALMERAAGERIGAFRATDDAEPTLDALLADTWSELTRHGETECPICGESMAPVYAAHARPVGGRCTACGTEMR